MPSEVVVAATLVLNSRSRPCQHRSILPCVGCCGRPVPKTAFLLGSVVEAAGATCYARPIFRDKSYRRHRVVKSKVSHYGARLWQCGRGSHSIEYIRWREKSLLDTSNSLDDHLPLSLAQASQHTAPCFTFAYSHRSSRCSQRLFCSQSLRLSPSLIQLLTLRISILQLDKLYQNGPRLIVRILLILDGSC